MQITLRNRLSTLVDATRKAIDDPTDTAQAFRIVEALSFDAPARTLAHLRRDPVGRRLLRDKDELLPVLTDRARLEAMPAGSLGRAYLDFIDSEGITAEGLVDASIDGAGNFASAGAYTGDEELAYMSRRLRDSHDLWHVVAGYKGDLLGEAALLAFTFAQTRHLGVGFLSAVAFTKMPFAELRRFVAHGFVRGKRAAWLPAQDWVALLARPLEDVRYELGITSIPIYEPARPPLDN